MARKQRVSSAGVPEHLIQRINKTPMKRATLKNSFQVYYDGCLYNFFFDTSCFAFIVYPEIIFFDDKIDHQTLFMFTLLPNYPIFFMYISWGLDRLKALCY
jgi:hypothetical protein